MNSTVRGALEELYFRILGRYLPLLLLSLKLLAGRRWWLIPPLMSLYSFFQVFCLLIGWRQGSFDPVSVQTALIGFPLMILGAGLGLNIMAGEIEDRTVEMTFTVPGGARRVWAAKLTAAVVILLLAAAVLGLWSQIFFVPVGLSAFYGSLQESIFYLVAAMALGLWSGSRLTGAMLTAVLFAVNALVTGFGTSPLRISPTFNPLALGHQTPAEVLALTIQNRVGILLLIIALVAMSFARAENRERMLR